MSPSPRRRARLRAAILPALLLPGLLLVAAPGVGQELFPEPFLVEHRLVQHDAGEVMAMESVVDHYGGSWIVSVRGDGSRLIVDLERRQLTEIRPSEGVYSSLDFDRLASLQRRLARLLAGEGEATRATVPAELPDAIPDAKAAESQDDLWVSELPPVAAKASRTGGKPWEATGVRRFAVVQGTDDAAATRGKAVGDQEPVLESWVSPAVRLTRPALDAIESWERSLNGGEASPAVAAVRRHAEGSLVVKTRRPLPSGSRGALVVEDETLRVEPLDSLPLDLVQVPVGLRRVPHGLEVAVATLEAERRIETGGAS